MDSIVPQSDETGQHTRENVARLQRLLAEAIIAREWALNRVIELEAQTDVKHWFIPDDGGYCQACGLPAKNGRHAPRKAA